MSTVRSQGGRPERPMSCSSLREVLGDMEYSEALLAARSMMDFDRVSLDGLLAVCGISKDLSCENDRFGRNS